MPSSRPRRPQRRAADRRPRPRPPARPRRRRPTRQGRPSSRSSIEGGQPVGGAQQVDLALGAEVTIRVTADVEDEVHVHGYDLLSDVAPGAPTEITFFAEIPGQFEVELEGAGVTHRRAHRFLTPLAPWSSPTASAGGPTSRSRRGCSPTAPASPSSSASSPSASCGPGPGWRRPRPGGSCPGGSRGSGPPGVVVLRAIGLFVYGVMLVACLWGVNNSAVQPGAVRHLRHVLGRRAAARDLRRRRLARRSTRSTRIALVVFGRRLPDRTDRPDPGLWPAARDDRLVRLARALPTSTRRRPGRLAVWLVGYSVAALVGAVAVGPGVAAARARASPRCSASSPALAPLFRDDETGRLRIRWPLTGLATGHAAARARRPDPRRARLDDLRRPHPARLVDARHRRRRATGWERSLVYTVGLPVHDRRRGPRVERRHAGCRPASPTTIPREVADAYLPSLVPDRHRLRHRPLLLAVRLRDLRRRGAGVRPLRPGLGPVRHDRRRDRLPARSSTTKIAWVQAGAIVVGHVAASSPPTTGPSSATARPKVAGRSQWPLVGAMVLYTVGGLGLLLGA